MLARYVVLFNHLRNYTTKDILQYTRLEWTSPSYITWTEHKLDCSDDEKMNFRFIFMFHWKVYIGLSLLLFCQLHNLQKKNMQLWYVSWKLIWSTQKRLATNLICIQVCAIKQMKSKEEVTSTGSLRQEYHSVNKFELVAVILLQYWQVQSFIIWEEAPLC